MAGSYGRHGPTSADYQPAPVETFLIDEDHGVRHYFINLRTRRNSPNSPVEQKGVCIEGTYEVFEDRTLTTRFGKPRRQKREANEVYEQHHIYVTADGPVLYIFRIQLRYESIRADVSELFGSRYLDRGSHEARVYLPVLPLISKFCLQRADLDPDMGLDFYQCSGIDFEERQAALTVPASNALPWLHVDDGLNRRRRILTLSS